MFRRLLAAAAILLGIAGCGGGGSSTPSTSQWTIMVYMNAANDLEPDGPFNIEQMQQAAGNPGVRIVVEWQESQAITPAASFDGTRRYLIQPGSSSAVQSTLVQDLGATADMGLPNTLNSFVTWAKATYPANRYALVLWDHGNGWRPKQRLPGAPNAQPAFSYNYETGNAIQIWQLPQALGTQNFDMIVWDCSLMQMVEVAYELRANTRYVVGSEESPPATGFPYDTILKNFQNNPTKTTLALAESWVDGMNGVVGYASDPIEESVVDTTQLPALVDSGGPIDDFAAQLNDAMPGITSISQTVRTEAKSYDSTLNPPRYYYDLSDLATTYQTLSNVTALQTAAAAVVSAVPNAVVYEKHNSNSTGSHGLSIDFSPSTAFVSSQSEYDQLAFADQNRWAMWLSIAP